MCATSSVDEQAERRRGREADYRSRRRSFAKHSSVFEIRVYFLSHSVL